jgi:hypothetical protein
MFGSTWNQNNQQQQQQQQPQQQTGGLFGSSGGGFGQSSGGEQFLRLAADRSLTSQASDSSSRALALDSRSSSSKTPVAAFLARATPRLAPALVSNDACFGPWIGY